LETRLQIKLSAEDRNALQKRAKKKTSCGMYANRLYSWYGKGWLRKARIQRMPRTKQQIDFRVPDLASLSPDQREMLDGRIVDALEYIFSFPLDCRQAPKVSIDSMENRAISLPKKQDFKGALENPSRLNWEVISRCFPSICDHFYGWFDIYSFSPLGTKWVG